MNERLLFQSNFPRLEMVIEAIGTEEIAVKIIVTDGTGTMHEHMYPNLCRGEGFSINIENAKVSIRPERFPTKEDGSWKKGEQN